MLDKQHLNIPIASSFFYYIYIFFHSLCPLTGQWRWVERTLLAADSGGTHLSGAQTRKAAVGERQKSSGAGEVHRRLACADHRRETKYSHVPERSEKSYLGGFTADTLAPLVLIGTETETSKYL